jgi:NTP pyrophosphatase (non-canonical NTP hydrolase)
MQFTQFQPLALVTEARIEKVQANRIGLLALLSLSIATTEIMDQVKKSVFYGRAINEEAVTKRIAEIQSMTSILKDADIPNADKEVIDIDPRLFHGIIGKFTEVGEMLEAMEEHIATGTPLDVVNLREELGDDSWYNAIICDATGIRMEDTLALVIDKLRARYGDKFDAYLANNRDLTTERQILESKPVSEVKEEHF